MAENEKVQQTSVNDEKGRKTPSGDEKGQKSAAKDEKAGKKDKKPGFFARAGKWLRELRSELKKVQWPTASQTLNNTLIVIVCVLVVGVFIWLFDALATSVIGAVISLFKG